MAIKKTLDELEKEYGLGEFDSVQNIVPILEGDPYDAYYVLRSNIEKVNRKIRQDNTPSLFDMNYHSFTKGIKKKLIDGQSGATTINIERKYVYGIVLGTKLSDISPDRLCFYVDVPGFNQIIIPHPDELTFPEFEWQKIEHLKFFPLTEDADYQLTSCVGSIAIVTLGPNFPAPTPDNFRENIILGFLDERPFVSCLTKVKKISEITSELFKKIKQQTSENVYDPSKKSIFYRIGEKFNATDVPVPGGKVTSVFGYAPNPTDPEKGMPVFNHGIEIEGQLGSPVYAVADGEIIFSNTVKEGDLSSFSVEDGISVAIKHGKNFFTTYCNLLKNNVKKGEKIKKGDIIGSVGQRSGKPRLFHEHRKQMVYKSSSIEPSLTLRQINLGERQEQKFSGVEGQGIPAPFVPPIPSKAKNAFSASRPRNRPKMLLIKVNTDKVLAHNFGLGKGSSHVLVREDIAGEIQAIKDILNFYEIPLTCNLYDISLKDKNLTPLQKVGLEINLNNKAGLVHNSFDDRDEYFIGPDYSKPYGKGFLFKIYGNVRIKKHHEKYKFEEKIIDIYDIKNTYLLSKPQIRKIFRPVLDITKILNDYGFIVTPPEQIFFENSDNNKSNWFKIYKPPKIHIGYTYKELLETVYDLSEYKFIDIDDKAWNGEKFEWQSIKNQVK